MGAFNTTSLVSIDFSKMPQHGFPTIIDDTSLSFKLGIKNRTLWYLLNQRNDEKKGEAYKCFSIIQKDKKGRVKKKREIQEPNPQLKRIHKVLNNMFSSLPMDESISAYVKGKNCADAARQHVREDVVLTDIGPTERAMFENDPKYSLGFNDHEEEVAYQHICMIKLDLKDFFPSIRTSWIRKFFHEEVGYGHQVSSLFASLCSVKRVSKGKSGKEVILSHLPQGSPLSGSLSNIVAFHMFGKKIKEYLAEHGDDWVYTIYADDITMTHPSKTLSKEEADKVRDDIIKIITATGFEINDKKTVTRRTHEGQLKVLGCIVNRKLNVPAKVRNGLKCIIHNCKTKGFESQLRGRKSVDQLQMYIQGMLQYVRSIRPDIYEDLNEMYKEALAADGRELVPDSQVFTLWSN